MGTKLSELPVIETLNDDDIFYVVQDGVSKQVALSNIVQSSESWQRPADWLDVPETATNTVHILVAIYDVIGNHVALSCSTSSGTYHVDWGDGTSSDVASSFQAEHQYSYSNTALDGTESSRGYKQAWITVTGLLTSVNLGSRHSALSTAYSQPFLEIQLNAPNCTSFYTYTTVALRLLENCNIVAIGNITSASTMFMLCGNLYQVTFPAGSFANTTNTADMFSGCTRLISVSFPAGSLSLVTNTSNMFITCNNLTSVSFPAGSLSLVTNTSSMFYSCYRLKEFIAPAGAFAAVTTAASMFTNCWSIKTITFKVSLATVSAASNMFQNCLALTDLAFDGIGTFGLVSNFSSMFSGCTSLPFLPSGINYGSATNVTSLFSSCFTLSHVEFPAGALPLTTNATNMFINCYSLRSITFPSGAFALLTTSTNMFSNCYSLSAVNGCAIPISFSLGSSILSATALDAIYTSLPVVVAKTITVTGNYGTSGDNPSIATAKGWTVA